MGSSKEGSSSSSSSSQETQLLQQTGETVGNFDLAVLEIARDLEREGLNPPDMAWSKERVELMRELLNIYCRFCTAKAKIETTHKERERETSLQRLTVHRRRDDIEAGIDESENTSQPATEPQLVEPGNAAAGNASAPDVFPQIQTNNSESSEAKECEKRDALLRKNINALMVVTTVIASMAYAAGLNPPGKDSSYQSYTASPPGFNGRYQSYPASLAGINRNVEVDLDMFSMCNACALASSLFAMYTLLVYSMLPLKKRSRKWLSGSIRVVMLAATLVAVIAVMLAFMEGTLSVENHSSIAISILLFMGLFLLGIFSMLFLKGKELMQWWTGSPKSGGATRH